MSLPARARRTIRTHSLFPARARVLVALSGGPDSVALLHVLQALEPDGTVVVAGAAHFNHQLRGAAADADEAFCRGLCDRLGVAFVAGRGDVRALAQASKRSLEDAARTARYAFLERAADELEAAAIAVGHSLDDQAETFLLRLLRGAGARGLGGIRPRAGRVVRPLLEISRADLRSYVAAHGLEYRDDDSNRDVTIARNRLRAELMPVLEAYAPGIAEVLARDARLAQADEDYLSRRAIELAPAIVLPGVRGAELNAAGLRELPPALASRVARLALETTAAGRFIGFQHIDGVLALAAGRDGAAVTLPGVVARRQGDRIVIGPAGTAAVPAFSNSFRFPLSIPGEVALGSWTVSAERLDEASPAELSARGPVALVPTEPMRLPLAVRTRRRGDRFHPLGMGGRGRKLQDFLVDRKVDRLERDALPLVVDADDRIVWVVGQSVAEDFRITGPRHGVILLKARRLGGVG